MKCPCCGYEPVGALLEAPCPICHGGWMDTYEYINMLANPLVVETVLDIGCGDKGVIAQHYWENVQRIKRGYACDCFRLKPLPPLWTPLLADAESLPELIDPVDVVTHCGMLEHVAYEKAFRVLHAVEQVARKLVFFSCSTELRQVDYKVKRDGNPYHYYRSWWDAQTFEALGYHVDRARMFSGKTFRREAICWFHPRGLMRPWEEREAEAKRLIAARRCCMPGCNAEPFAWVSWEPPFDNYYCAVHYVDKLGDDARDVRWWIEQPPRNVEHLLADCVPSWREEKLIGRLP